MTIRNMAKLNMVFREGCLLAGVIMAANMFTGNEVKAMNQEEGDTYKKEKLLEEEENERIIEELRKKKEETNKNKVEREKKKRGKSGLKSFLGFLSSYENTINIIGGAVLSVFNNYTKWWDYNPGCYGQFGRIGWRSKRFLNNMFQFDINLNLGRGVLWLIPGAYNFINFIKLLLIKVKDSYDYIKCLHVSYLVASNLFNGDSMQITAIIVFFLLQGFVSMPLTFHLSKFNFGIEISLDSIIWAGIGNILYLKVTKQEKEEENKLKLMKKNAIKESNEQIATNDSNQELEKIDE